MLNKRRFCKQSVSKSSQEREFVYRQQRCIYICRRSLELLHEMPQDIFASPKKGDAILMKAPGLCGLSFCLVCVVRVSFFFAFLTKSVRKAQRHILAFMTAAQGLFIQSETWSFSGWQYLKLFLSFPSHGEKPIRRAVRIFHGRLSCSSSGKQEGV
eukprot:TRINITY_DN481_c0_g1_i12.p1 TRINITY_DN481_c0_g1~~TRINITY_DN481_c0_g1_i12.p1  ORF type:complete len:156 (-),score=24.82 TRINITY_DN481_c0_g1_i12:899-1366(-)